MDRDQLVQELGHAMEDLLQDLPRPERTLLPALTASVVLEGSVAMARLGAGIPGLAQDRSKERRVQRLLANPRYAVSRLQRRLAARVLQHTQGRLHLLLDATTTGATRRHPGTVTLMLAIAHRGRAVPLLWTTWTTDAPDQQWRVAIRAMGETLQPLLPAGTEIVLLADRGLTGRPLVETARALGWHFTLRAKANATIKCGEHEPQTFGSLVPEPGSRRSVTEAAIWVPQPKSHHQGAQPDWTRACHANLVAVWRTGDAEPWLLVTDLAASRVRCTEYRTRTWEEALFRDLKSMGWNWQASRLQSGERVARLLGILVLATLWMLGVGERVRRRGQRILLEERSRSCYSLFQLGRRAIHRCLTNNQPLPVVLTLASPLGSLRKLS